MGTWGTAISSNDTYSDVYTYFFDLYNNGIEVREISKQVIAKNQEIINDADDSNNFWFALAKAQWECKQLDEDLFNKVKRIIDAGADLKVWRQLNAKEKDIQKRKLALDKFLSRISIEKSKAKPRKKKIIRQPIFEKGDCIAFKFDNGNYGGAIVLEAINDTELGLNLIAPTRINQQNKPSLKDFQKSNILVKSFGSWNDQVDIRWCYAQFFNKENIELEKIGKIEVEINYNPNDYSNHFGFGGTATDFKKMTGLQFEYEMTNNRPAKMVRSKDLISRNKFKF